MKVKASEEDIRWARKHGWDYDEEHNRFTPIPFYGVVNLGKGWCPWVGGLGALQMDAPFASPRAALRVAEGLRRGKTVSYDEMDCSEKA